jgi:predicted HTH transcriptional regulator
VSFDPTPFDRLCTISPQPVALALARVLSARTTENRLDAILRCAEILARYTCVAALSSFAARDAVEIPPIEAITSFRGDLAFGRFLAVAQGMASLASDHPLRDPIQAGFQGRKGRRGPADEPLVGMLKLRNDHGHELQGINRHVAEHVFKQDHPDELLLQALRGLEPLLRLPLFLLENQTVSQGRILAQRLLLMGETPEPRPDTVGVATALHEPDHLYLGLPTGALELWPFLIWEYGGKGATFSAYFVDSIGNEQVRFASANGEERVETRSAARAVVALRNGESRPMEPVILATGQSLAEEWTKTLEARQQYWGEVSGEIPWDDLDPEIIEWYTSRLGAGGDVEERRESLRECLLSGRDRLNPDEIRQLVLLFGTEGAVRKQLRREMLDCRSRLDPQKRWDERLEWSGNLFGALREALGFFGRHIGGGAVTLDGLQATDGSPDYVALREALINCFCHQDYGDASTTCQIELTPDRTSFFNPGKSMVSTTDLIEGGKSTRRNPLIAQALRLVGFAELGGSGIRELQRVWRGAGRRPPSFQSDAKGNTFTLVLDWRPLPNTSDAFWRRRLGVKISTAEAKVLTLATDPAGVTAEQVASAEAISVDDAKQLVESLIRQGLIAESAGKIRIQDHLADAAAEASAIQWLQKELSGRPRRIDEIGLLFEEQREAGRWGDTALDLHQLLAENFLRFDGADMVPNQLHSYFTAEREDLALCSPSDPALREAAEGHWYLPDVKDSTDGARLRERELLADYNTYRDSRTRKYEPPSLDALRTGFERAWRERDYRAIVEVGSKVPEDLLQEDPIVLRWYDQAQQRLQEQG